MKIMGVVLLMMMIGGLIIAAILSAVSYFTKTTWLKTLVLGDEERIGHKRNFFKLEEQSQTARVK